MVQSSLPLIMSKKPYKNFPMDTGKLAESKKEDIPKASTWSRVIPDSEASRTTAGTIFDQHSREYTPTVMGKSWDVMNTERSRRLYSLHKEGRTARKVGQVHALHKNVSGESDMTRSETGSVYDEGRSSQPAKQTTAMEVKTFMTMKGAKRKTTTAKREFEMNSIIIEAQSMKSIMEEAKFRGRSLSW